MKAARQVLTRFASKIVPATKVPTSTTTKVPPSRLDTEQLSQVVGGGSPKGTW